LQRLQNDEREVTRDLSRLKRDLGRLEVALFIGRSSSITTSPSLSQALQSKKRSHGNKSSTEIDSDDLYLYQHAETIEREKEHVEQKLKKFFL
jgi:hypothetical protein